MEPRGGHLFGADVILQHNENMIKDARDQLENNSARIVMGFFFGGTSPPNHQWFALQRTLEALVKNSTEAK